MEIARQNIRRIRMQNGSKKAKIIISVIVDMPARMRMDLLTKQRSALIILGFVDCDNFAFKIHIFPFAG